MWKRWEGGGSLGITEVFKCHRGRATVPRQEYLGQVPPEQQQCRAERLCAEQDDGVAAPWQEAE